MNRNLWWRDEMPHLTLDIPEALAERLENLAAKENKSVAEVAVERLATVIPEGGLAERYKRFVAESGLFTPAPEAARTGRRLLTDAELARLAAKLGAAGPLSEVIIEERGEA